MAYQAKDIPVADQSNTAAASRTEEFLRAALISAGNHQQEADDATRLLIEAVKHASGQGMPPAQIAEAMGLHRSVGQHLVKTVRRGNKPQDMARFSADRINEISIDDVS